MHGNCPKCEKSISSVNCSGIDVRVVGGKTWKGISYNCPFCNTVLSVQIDPIAIKTDTVDDLFRKLRG